MVKNKELTLYLNYLHENKIILEDEEYDKKIQKIKDYYKKKRQELKDHRKDQLDALIDFGKDLAKTAADEFEIEKEVSKKRDRLIKFFVARERLLRTQEVAKINSVKRGGAIITGISLATILIYRSVQVYQEEKERRRRICENKTGLEKKKCLEDSKVISLKKRINFLNGAKIRCNSSKDPVACKSKLDKEIVDLKDKVNRYLYYKRVDVGLEF